MDSQPDDSASDHTRAEDNRSGVESQDDSRVGLGSVIAGRYVLGDRLGEGGMARVFLAYDVRLHRSVAVKVLRSTNDPAGEARILREAQAMAQLSHPNVLPVFDGGKAGAHAFIAMEFATGGTMRDWIRATPRSVASVCKVFAAAARGLHAAHVLGLVHRDFKPSNVMIDGSDRVRVMDFGLVRSESTPSSGRSLTMGGVTMSVSGLEQLTTTGTVMGTPGYMAPEQHGSESVDARADQYGFCVALYEAVCGELPFRADTLGDLVTAKLAGIRTLPPSSKLPKELRALVLTGLSVDPAARHPSMEAIAVRLDKMARPRRAVWLAAAGVTAVAVVGAAAPGFAADREAPCHGGADRLGGVWGDARRSELVQAVAASGATFATATGEALVAHFDAWRVQWLAGYTDACEATHVRKDQSEALLDRRMACLDQRRDEADATITVLGDRPDAGTLARAVDAVALLSGPADCADTARLDRAVTAPSGELAARISAVRGLLARARAIDLTGRYAEGQVVAEKAVLEAKAIAYAPLLADALVMRARLRRDAGERLEAKHDLEAAYELAIGVEHDEGARAIAIDLIELNADYLESGERAREWAIEGRAWSTRTHAPATERARLLLATAAAERHAGAYLAAQAVARETIVMVDRELGAEHPFADKARNILGIALAEQGQGAEARLAFTQARGLRIARLGPAHPHVAQVDNNIASTYIDERDFTSGKVWAERAVAGATTALGEEHPEVAGYIVNLALANEGLGDDREAVAQLRRALAIQQATLGSEHAAVGRTLLNLGGIVVRVDGPDAAVGFLEQARNVFARALGPDHPHVGLAEGSLGAALHDAGRLDEALGHLDEALRIGEQAQPRGAAELVAMRMSRLGLTWESGRKADAAVQLGALLTILADPETDTLAHARPRFELAKLVWAYFPERRSDAAALARAAQAAYDRQPSTGDPHEAELRAWLAAQG